MLTLKTWLLTSPCFRVSEDQRLDTSSEQVPSTDKNQSTAIDPGENGFKLTKQKYVGVFKKFWNVERTLQSLATTIIALKVCFNDYSNLVYFFLHENI